MQGENADCKDFMLFYFFNAQIVVPLLQFLIYVHYERREK